MTTSILGIPEIAASQAGKNITHNEALRQIEGQLVRVYSMTLAAQPSAADGDTYIIPAGATGTDWANYTAGQIAHFYGGAWHAYGPTNGLTVTVLDLGVRYRYDGTAWVPDSALVRYPVKTVAVNYTVTGANRGQVLLVDTSGGPITITLPAASIGSGMVVGIVKKTADVNAVTIAAAGTDLIAGAATLTLDTQFAGTLADSDGIAAWYEIGGGGGGAKLPLPDDKPTIANLADPTKQARFDASAILTGTTRVATLPDKSGTLAMLSDITGGGLASSEFDVDTVSTTGLTWGYLAGNLRVGAIIYTLAAGTVTLAASATNYVELDPATQTVSVNQVGYTTGRIPLRELVTDTTTVTTDTDRRAWVVGGQLFYADGLTATLNCHDQVVQSPELKDYAETRTAPASSAGALTVDLAAGNHAEITLTESVTALTLANPPAAGKAGSLTLVIHQDATGGWAITWPAAIRWPGGTAPVITAAASATDVITLMTYDGGTTWYGFAAGQAMS